MEELILLGKVPTQKTGKEFREKKDWKEKECRERWKMLLLCLYDCGKKVLRE